METRELFDPLKLRDLVIDGARSAFESKLNRLETSNMRLQVSEVEQQKKDFDTQEQKDQILYKNSLTVPIKAKVELINKDSNTVIDSKKMILAHVPWITERNTQIVNGTEYIPIHQSRLNPGVYHRIKESGEQEQHINVTPGTGLGGRIIFFPQKQLFVYMVQNTQIRLYGLLRALGIRDEQMKQQWGEQILRQNKIHFKGDELTKLYNKLFDK